MPLYDGEPKNWITAWGARPEPGFDNTDAMRRTIAHVFKASNSGIGEIVIPDKSGLGNAGSTYEFHQNNPFHPQAAGVAAGWGIRFVGHGMNRSICKLVRDSGNPIWYYDAQNGPNVTDTGLPGMNRGPMVFDMMLTSDMPNPLLGRTYSPTHAADVNGFRWWAGPSPASPAGHDKMALFERCRFAGLGTPVEWAGSFSTDATTFRSCRVQNCGPFVAHNLNALLVLWDHCNLWYPQDLLQIKSTNQGAGSPNGGGGDFVFDTCDLIHEGYVGEDLDVPYYTQHFVDGEIKGADWTRYTHYRKCRWELRSRNSCLYKDRGTVSALPSREALYDGCTISIQHGTDLLTQREYIQLGPNKVVSFRNSSLPRQFAVGFYDCNNASIPGLQNQPTVLMDDCMLFPDFIDELKDRLLPDAATNPSGHGRVVCRRGRSITPSREAGAVRRTSYNFDYSKAGKAAGAGELCGTKYTVYLKAFSGAWPSLPSGVPTAERTIYLPPGTTINAAWGRKPASGTASTLVQWNIGKDDKSYAFVSSAPGRADSEHRFRADASTHPDIFPYVVGEDGETIRCWMGPTESSYTATGGEIALELE